MITHGELQYTIELIFTVWLVFLIVAFMVGAITWYVWWVKTQLKEQANTELKDLISKLQTELEKPEYDKTKSPVENTGHMSRTHALVLLHRVKVMLGEF